MRVSFNTAVELTSNDIIQVVAIMQADGVKITKKSFKTFVNYSVKFSGTSWLSYTVNGNEFSHNELMAAWAVALNTIDPTVTMPVMETSETA